MLKCNNIHVIYYFIHSFLFKVFEYNMSLSMLSTSGSDHSNGYDNVRKILLMCKIS